MSSSDSNASSSSANSHQEESAEEIEIHNTLLNYQHLVNSLSDGYNLADNQGYFTDANDAFCSLLGYRKEEILGLHFRDISPPENADIDALIEEQIQERGISDLLEKSFLHRDGHKVPVSIQVHSRRNKHNEKIGAWSIIRPLVHEKVLQNKIKTSETNYRSLFNLSLDAISLSSIEGTMLDVNPAFCEMLGYSKEELLSKTYRDFTPPNWVETEDTDVRRQLLKHGFTDVYDKEYIHKDGYLVPISIRLFGERDEDGDINKVWAIARNQLEQKTLMERVQDSEEHFQNLFHNSFDAIAYYRADDYCLMANQAYSDLIGYSVDEVRGMHPRDFTAPGWDENDAKLTEQILTQGYSDVIEKEFVHKDGHIVPVSVRAFAVNKDGVRQGTWLIFRDISSYRKTLKRLGHSQQLLEQTGRLARVGGWEYEDGNHQLHFTNEVFRILGLPTNFKGKMSDTLNLFSQESRYEIRASIEVALMLNTPFDIEVEYLGFKQSRWIRLTGRVRRDDNGQKYIVGAIQDITDYKDIERQLTESKERMEHLAFHDPLTELPNRLLLNDRLRHAVNRAKRNSHELTFMLLDLDQFKVINDTLGHLAGDKFLLEVSRRLKETVRKDDTIARMGGDEFVVLLEKCGLQHAKKIAASILETVAQPMRINHKDVHCTASIGIVVYPTHGHDSSAMYQLADSAMYEAKARGKNFMVFASELPNSEPETP